MELITENTSKEFLENLKLFAWAMVIVLPLFYMIAAWIIYADHSLFAQYYSIKHLVETANIPNSAKNAFINYMNAWIYPSPYFPLDTLIEATHFIDPYVFLGSELSFISLALILRRINKEDNEKIL